MFSEDFKLERPDTWGPGIITIQSKMIEEEDYDGEVPKKVNNIVEA